jgi:alpha-galactosidase
MTRALLAALVLFSRARALNNGFSLPAMGYSTWNDCSSFRDNGPHGWCWDSEAHVRNVTLYLRSSGLFALGYNRINIDEGWLLGRNSSGMMYEDLDKFPSGMKGLGDWVKAQGFHYGLYSCRTGNCRGTSTYKAPGSLGYEKADVQWMVNAGADYLKIDSVRCCLPTLASARHRACPLPLTPKTIAFSP